MCLAIERFIELLPIQCQVQFSSAQLSSAQSRLEVGVEVEATTTSSSSSR